MKKRLVGVFLLLCIMLTLLPSGVFASSNSNGKLAYMDLAVKATSEDVINANGLYQKYIYEYYENSGTTCLLQYNMEEDYVLVTLLSVNDTSSQLINLVIPSDLVMPYHAYSEFTLTSSGATASAFTTVNSLFSSSRPLELFDTSGVFTESELSAFEGSIRSGLSLALACVQKYCFNDSIWSIGDLGFTNYANELGVSYGVSIPDTVPTVINGKLGDNVYWKLYDEGRLYIYGTGPMYDYMTYTLSGQGPLYQIRHFIKNVYIDYGVTNVGGYVFDQCSSMEGIYMAPSVSEIKYYAFAGCRNLSDLSIIPYAMTSIGDGAFTGCDSLKEVYYHGNLTEWSKIAIGQYNDPLVSAVVYPNYHYSEAVERVNPTCTKEGTEAYWKCECGKVFSDEDCDHEISAPVVIPKTAHTWDNGKITQQPTEQAEGIKTYTCTTCGTTRTESIPKLTPSPSTTNPFTDVHTGEYYYEPVLWAVNHNPLITNGTSATTFSPEATCTRGQVVTFLWRAAGEPEPKSMNNPFTDVSKAAYYNKAVLWAVEQGITNGTSATTFSPNDPCTRAHVVTFLWRFEHEPDAYGSNPFKDVQANQYYTNAVLWAVSEGITNGTDATHFSPDSPCTRGQIVTFLYRDLH